MRGTGERPDDEYAPKAAASRLYDQLEHTPLPRHLALFYRTEEEQLGTVATYLRHGFDRGERCLYLYDVNDPARIRAALRKEGVNVSERVEAGDLVVRDASSVYLENGFEPERMIGTLEDACADSVADGYEGIRVAGENTWCFHTSVSFDHILDFEVRFDRRCSDFSVTALCQYDLDRFGEESVAKAIWTHERILYRNTLCENPYYVPPGEYRDERDPELNARLMLEQTYGITWARRQVERREERLAVLNRVLRHNVRNDLNVVAGNLETVLDDDLSPETRARVRTALDYTTAVVETAEKARHVQDSVGPPTTEARNLATMVKRARRSVESTHPDAEVTVDGLTDVSVLADADFETALSELLSNALVHQDGTPPRATLTVDTNPPDVVVIEVTNPGEPIPEVDRRALHEGTETPLRHASGIGLWLVKWLTENAGGRLRFPDRDGRAVVRVELPRS